jgi:CHAT domain-containing protein
VDDRASHRLFVAFHRALRKGQTATDALRSAQLSALTGPDPFLQNPANWASFTVIGGVSALVGSDRPLFGPAIVGTSNSNH